MDLFDLSVTIRDVGSTARAETLNITQHVHVPRIWSTSHLIVTSLVLGVLILCTIIGNAFVIAAVILEKTLHRVANFLILSLAVSDCLVAVSVMPVSAVNEVTQHWFMGRAVCDMWVAMDVLCCTASIYGLVAISVDRYWAVTKVEYMRKRTNKRMYVMIAIVWIAALSISIPSVWLLKDERKLDEDGICLISQDRYYTIISTISAFYLPTVILIIIYTKIFLVARERILRKKFSDKCKNLELQIKSVSPQINNTPEMTLRVQYDEYPAGSKSDFSETFDGNVGNCYANDSCHQPNQKIYYTSADGGRSNARDEIMRAKREKEKLKRKRERKVAWTLTIITGTFITCWLPFFIIAISAPFIRSKVTIPRLAESITLWLGYSNCLLNPIIYTVFNEEFRMAFKKIFLKRCLKMKTYKEIRCCGFD